MGTKAYPTNPLPEISGKTRRSRAGKASGYAQRLIDDTPHELDNGDDALAAQSAGQVVVDQSSHAGAFPGSRKPLESNRISVASFKQATKSWYPQFMFRKTRGKSQTNTGVVSAGEMQNHRERGETKDVDTEKLTKKDTIIALIGPTGAGKSSFISTTVDQDEGIGHSLEPCTSEISAIRVQVPGEDFGLVLVDTPGFDDTYKSDLQILELISDWLERAGRKRILLSGILYFHRISDNRMARTPLKCLEMFEKLCGYNASSHIVMVTTMWDKLGEDEIGERREDDLKSMFWASMLTRGSTIERYKNTKESAWNILEHFLGAPRERQELQLQRELIDMERTLPSTAAGKELSKTINDFVKKQGSLVRTLQEQMNKPDMDKDVMALLQEQYEELERQRRDLLKDVDVLRVPMNKKLREALTSIPPRYLRWFEQEPQFQTPLPTALQSPSPPIVGAQIFGDVQAHSTSGSPLARETVPVRQPSYNLLLPQPTLNPVPLPHVLPSSAFSSSLSLAPKSAQAPVLSINTPPSKGPRDPERSANNHNRSLDTTSSTRNVPQIPAVVASSRPSLDSSQHISRGGLSDTNRPQAQEQPHPMITPIQAPVHHPSHTPPDSVAPLQVKTESESELTGPQEPKRSIMNMIWGWGWPLVNHRLPESSARNTLAGNLSLAHEPAQAPVLSTNTPSPKGLHNLKRSTQNYDRPLDGTSGTRNVSQPLVVLASSRPSLDPTQLPIQSGLLVSGSIAPAQSSSRGRSRILLSRIITNASQKSMPMDHKDAQIMADFLSTILSEEKEILFTSEGNRILVMLRKLSTSARVFPQRFVLKNVTYDPALVAVGGFASVHKGEYHKRSVCVKIVLPRVNEKECIKELILWAHLSHPNILPLYGVVIGDNLRVRLVSPWMDNGTLCAYSSKRLQPSRMPLISDVINGLLYLHNLNVVHSDLKGENVLVSDQGRALIADFGISHISTSTARQKCTTSLIGASKRWAPPEYFDQDPDTPIRPAKAQDVWSFGCLCYEVLSRRPPFYQCRADVHVMRALDNKEIPLRPGPGHEDWDEIGDEMWALMETCWSYAPEARPTLQDISNRFSRLDIPDDRPEVQDGPGSGLAQEDPIELDFDRVENILLNVSKSR